jgi:hypothetical protein
VIPSTGSATFDLVLEIVLVGALVALLVLLIRNYRDR